MLFFLLPLFSTIILDAGGDKLEVGLRFFWDFMCGECFVGFWKLEDIHRPHRRFIRSPKV